MSSPIKRVIEFISLRNMSCKNSKHTVSRPSCALISAPILEVGAIHRLQRVAHLLYKRRDPGDTNPVHDVVDPCANLRNAKAD